MIGKPQKRTIEKYRKVWSILLQRISSRVDREPALRSAFITTANGFIDTHS